MGCWFYTSLGYLHENTLRRSDSGFSQRTKDQVQATVTLDHSYRKFESIISGSQLDGKCSRSLMIR